MRREREEAIEAKKRADKELAEQLEVEREIVGKQQAESPECMPAGSTCSIKPAITTEPSESHKASTSISIALFKY